MPDSTPASRPTHKRFAVMALLCGLSFLTYFDRVCIMRARNDIQHDLSLSDEQFGIVMGAFWLAYGLFEIPAGWFGDRSGARFTLTRIVLAWSLFTSLSGAATGFVSLVTFRFLFGVGEAGAYPNMARIQSRWLPVAVRAQAGGLLWLMARWGGAFSPVIFGSMLRFYDSAAFRATLGSLPLLNALHETPAWRLTFFSAGLVGLAWCLVFFFYFRDDPRDKKSVNAAELALITGGMDRPEIEIGTRAAIWKALFTSRSLWAMGLLYLSGSFGWSFFVSWMPKYFEDVHHLKYEKSEWMSVLPLFCGGISCFVGGWLSDRFLSRWQNRWLAKALFPMCGYTIAAGAMLGLRLARTPEDAVILLTVAAAGFDFGQGANWATIIGIGGKYVGCVTGFVNMVGNMGNVLQPVIGEKIFNTFSWNTLFIVLACAYLFAASMWLFIDPQVTFYERRESK